VFKTDPFSMQTLTASVLKMPYKPGRIGQLSLFSEKPIATRSVVIEEKDGVLSLVTSSPRGGAGPQLTVNKRKGRSLIVPHFELNHALIADELQGVRAFGTESELEVVQQVVNNRFAEMVPSIDVTVEYLMLGALKGVILDGDGSTTLYDLFSEFEVTQEAEVGFNFAAHTTDDGAMLGKCRTIVRTIQNNLGAAMFDHVHAFCGANFFDAICKDPEVRESFRRASAANDLAGVGSFLREGNVRKVPLEFGDIIWEEYRGSVNGVDFIDTDKAIFFPVGVTPNIYDLYYAPADFWNTVNTLGLPRYARQKLTEDEKAVNLHVQTNPLPICLRPAALMAGRKGA
jgi:hypothetical protein